MVRGLVMVVSLILTSKRMQDSIDMMDRTACLQELKACKKQSISGWAQWCVAAHSSSQSCQFTRTYVRNLGLFYYPRHSSSADINAVDDTLSSLASHTQTMPQQSEPAAGQILEVRL